jgi:hypothetical protein
MDAGPDLADLVEIDGVGPAQDVEPLARDLTGDADGEVCVGKWRQPKKPAGSSNLQ